ncbi:pilus assembly protein [Saccharospirillum alexandrii]|uniref:pilus assembly protein n=1 Tax=Saccharospirillum alexandrii TaxID=2448477 RepID=UPI000FD7609A|nr:PilC/PilY family type IV pilus protein [Saccharospirillum alexandrii]
MNVSMLSSSFPKTSGLLQGLAVGLVCATASSMAQADIAQEPLFLGGGGIPGNMLLVPSVEWPTIESVANQNNTYTAANEFTGYFDSNKCYVYVYSATESERYFRPNSITSDRRCSGNGEWSGNFLNWAATQTIDPFRKVLTGGLRVKDTETETWLEKARHPGQGNIYPIRDLTADAEIEGATPFSADRIRVRISGMGTEMRFSLNNNNYNNSPTDYRPGVDNPYVNRGYEMSVRVSVCDESVGVEENCKQYGDNWKPEGLIQQDAENIRFSVFGYLNDSGSLRDGGVLRARQKYVGPRRLEAGTGFVDNEATEWDPDTGIFIQNPDPDDAADNSVSIVNSGVINYINKFGQLNTGNNKGNDPVSELFYTATRYLKNQGNVSAYSNMGGANLATREQWHDSFPVITDWEDPIQYACQANVFLGIGDTNTHDDKNLPGNTAFRQDEPAMPGELSADATVNVVSETNRVGQIEGIGNIGNTNSFNGRANSAYMAGLAWNNHVRDMRPDLPGMQTASTHWVDVLENQVLRSGTGNQYYLATKYGGFRVPEDFDPDTVTTLEEAWWHSNGDTPAGLNSPRPDNYYLAGEADAMVESLREAFSNIGDELKSSSAAVAANSTRLDTDTAVFQGSFNSQRWGGELAAFKIQDDGLVETEPAWVASEELPTAANRNIFTIDHLVEQTGGDADGEYRAFTGTEFMWDNLTDLQKAALRAQPDATLSTVAFAQDRLNYLRGDTAKEQTQEDQSKPFRRRDTLLGDIINSNPQFSHNANFGYGSLGNIDAFSSVGATSYADFRTDTASRSPIVMVGANDGMLHAFDADPDNGGEELFAFVPSSIYNNLYRLTLPGYAHRYYVDGTPRIADAWMGSEWATLAVGTTGAGGKSVFALDVTDPENFTASDVMWEFSHPNMGYTIQQPAVVALPSGQFGVVVTSGYHDDPTVDRSGYIWILNVNDGSIIRTIELGNSGELGSPLVVDLTSNSVADRIYVGDTEGKLWRIDLDGTNPDAWDAPSDLKPNANTIDPLFTEPNGRPITAQLTSAFNENKEHMVFFGTGSFIRVGENIVDNGPPIERFYGIIDRGEPIDDLADLLEQRIELEGSFGGPEGRRFRVVSDEEIEESDEGWYLPLIWAASEGGSNTTTGERVVARAIVRGDRVIFPTLIPDADPCAFGGNSWLMELEMENGGRLSYSVFDLDEDEEFNEDDFVNIGTEDDPIWVPTSGFDPEVGIINTPAVITGVDPTGSGDDDEVKVISGSSGDLISIPEAGTRSRGRQAWEQLR